MADKSSQELQEPPQTEKPSAGALRKKSSRRTFLRQGALVAAGLAIAPVINRVETFTQEPTIPIPQPDLASFGNTSHIHGSPLPGGGPTSEPRMPSGGGQPRKEPVVLPDDVLTPEQLKQANIRIIDSPKTKLHLREGALKDFKIFRDAAKGQLDEVVIVLTDHPVLSWKASESMPQEARDIYQALHYSPGERELEDYFLDLKGHEDQIKYWKSILKSNGPFPKPAPGSEIPGAAYLSDATKVTEHIRELEEALAKLRAQGAPKLTPEEIETQKNSGDALGEICHSSGITASSAIRSGRNERIVKARERYDLKNKIYIFMAVGGQSEPHPSQSFPSPHDIQSGTFAGTYGRTTYIFNHGRDRPGFVARHELAHYENAQTDNYGSYVNFYDETKADALAFASIVDAHNKGQEEGDNSGYSIIFVNKYGATYTKDQKTPSPTSNL